MDFFICKQLRFKINFNDASYICNYHATSLLLKVQASPKFWKLQKSIPLTKLFYGSDDSCTVQYSTVTSLKQNDDLLDQLHCSNSNLQSDPILNWKLNTFVKFNLASLEDQIWVLHMLSSFNLLRL